MAKTGKSGPAYDPFSAGNRAFPDLDKVLGDLDEAPSAPSSEPAPKERKPKLPAAPRSSKKTSLANSTKTTRTEWKAKTTPDGGGGEPARPGRTDSNKATKRFLTTRDEATRYEKAAIRLGAELGIRVDFSKLTRALWECYLKHEKDILRSVPEGEEWRRPGNNDGVGLAELDEQLTELVNEGFLLAGRRLRQAKR